MGLPANVAKYLASPEFSQDALLKKYMSNCMAVQEEVGGADVFSEADLTRSLKAQDDYDRADSVKGGVCQALSIKWIKMKVKEGATKSKGSQKPTPETRMMALTDNKRFEKAIVTQSKGKEKVG